MGETAILTQDENMRGLLVGLALLIAGPALAQEKVPVIPFELGSQSAEAPA